MATRVGTLLGRYQISAEIGRGTMGEVYRAWDPKISRTVAIKTVTLSGLEPEAEHEYRERFVVEAQAAGRLSHGGIITIFDVAEDEETRVPYLVMEYVEGKSLGQLLSGENGRLPLPAALQLAQELAEALHYAHAQGVIHRDIKPANILVTADGHAKIADFGIAKLNQAHLTQRGSVLGSPAYMAPEQLSDEGSDARSDLFSLGVVLYFMLTGQRPFQGNSIATVCFKVTNHEPLAVATYDLSFPPELDSVVSRAMAKNPAERYQSGGEMARDIQRLRERCGLIRTAELSQKIPHPPIGPGFGDVFKTIPSFAITRNRIFALMLLAATVVFVLFARNSTTGPPPALNPARATQPAIRQDNPGDPSLPYLPAPANAKLDLEIEHSFPDARASLWLDNQLVYTQVLHADPKNRLMIFRKTRGHLSRRVDLNAGKHEVKVRVQSQAAAYDQSRTLAVNFAPKGERTLRVNCDKKRNLLQVRLH